VDPLRWEYAVTHARHPPLPLLLESRRMLRRLARCVRLDIRKACSSRTHWQAWDIVGSSFSARPARPPASTRSSKRIRTGLTVVLYAPTVRTHRFFVGRDTDERSGPGGGVVVTWRTQTTPTSFVFTPNTS
jgi:hypothetical protein